LIEELRARRREGYELHRRYVNPAFVELVQMAGYGRRFVRAQGMELEDDEGRRYLDFVGGYGALNLGHNHPDVRAAIEAVLSEQVAGFTQVDCGVLEGLAAEKLIGALPSGFGKVFFCNSGAEAVEAGMKLARAATGRRRFVCCEGAYHGLTFGALSLHGNRALRKRFEPLLAEVDRVPFGDLRALEKALKGDVAAFVVEPILGEGGGVEPPAGYLAAARDLCRRFKALMVVDEVQTGMGRTGRMLALEHSGVVPDVVTLAKSLGGGLMPVGAMVCGDEVFARAYGSAQTCQDHNTTFGGGPLAMAAVIATLGVLREEHLFENAKEQGSYLKERLTELARKHEAIAEVRGKGLMLALKLRDVTRGLLEGTPLSAISRASSYVFAQYLALRLLDEHGIVVQTAVNDPGVLKVMPPLVVQGAHIDRFVQALDGLLGEGGHRKAMAHMAAAVVKQRLG